jgi:hypothetical protein
VAGWTGSGDFPGVGAGSADNTYAGPSEAFVAKLSSPFSLTHALLEKLKDLVAACEFCPPDPQDSLLDKINLAIKQVRKGNNRAAANALEQFNKRTERFIKTGQVPAAEGRRFMEMAEEIISNLGEGRVGGPA